MTQPTMQIWANHMNVLGKVTLLTVAMGIGGWSSLAQAGTLNQMVATSLPNNEMELRLAFDEAPPTPQAYELNNPRRLVLDLPDTRNGLTQREQTLGLANASSLNVVANGERTRVVINLTEAGKYTTRVVGNDLILRMIPDSAVKAATPASNTPEPIQPLSNNYSSRSGLGVSDINFRKGNGNAGQVLIGLSSASVPLDVQQQGSRIVVRFLGTRLTERLRRRLDVGNFNTPIKSINAYNDGNNGVVVIQPEGNFEYTAYQADNRLTISVKRPAPSPIRQLREPTYSGQRLSLNFQDIEVRSVLQLIADFTGLNLVASDTVQGRITIRLQNVPWDQALDIILRTKGLDKRRNGNVILIAPATEITEREKQEIMALQQVEQLAPLRTEYVQLNYAKAADILTLITQARSNQGNTGSTAGVAQNTANQGLLSTRGSASVDIRTNTLIIQDTAVKIDEIRNLLAKLDVPVRQVMIEARIVRATDNFSKELGVKWGILSDGTATNRNLLIGGSETTLFNLSNPQSTTLNGVNGVSYTIDRPANLNVDLGVTSAGASRIALGLLNLGNTMLDLELSALQADGRGEVVATPKVLTTDKQKARVAAGTQIPYQTATSSGATAISFINAELSLEVTPNITPDGRIGMELLVNSDTPGDVEASGARAINTNRVATNVLVEDGQTVVLGGIFQNQTTNNTTKTPFLGDLPYLGRLFKRDVRLNNKQELLIFVTPRLVAQTSNVR